jgi:hypothetical protein
VPPAPACAVAPAESGESGLSRVLHSRLALLVLIVVLLGAYVTYRIVGSHSAAAHTVAASDLKVGNCFTAPAGSSAVTGVKVQLIACDRPHTSEVFVEPAISDSSFSQTAVLHSEADDACNDADSQSDLSEILPAGYTIVDFYPRTPRRSPARAAPDERIELLEMTSVGKAPVAKNAIPRSALTTVPVSRGSALRLKFRLDAGSNGQPGSPLLPTIAPLPPSDKAACRKLAAALSGGNVKAEPTPPTESNQG